MVEEKIGNDIQEWQNSVDGEVYEELLNRYERILVFAGQLQEKLKQQKQLAEKNDSLSEENERLKQLSAVEQAYVRLLENALESLGFFKSSTGETEASK